MRQFPSLMPRLYHLGEQKQARVSEIWYRWKVMQHRWLGVCS
jgi:hypothetical protein